MSVLDRKELEQSPLADLHAIAAEVGVEGFRRMRRDDLISAILGEAGGDGAAEAAAEDEEDEEPRGRRRGRRGGRARRPRSADPGEEAETEPAEPAEPAEPEAAEADEAETEDVSEEPGEEAPEGVDAEAPEPEEETLRTGVLDILPNGSGFLRDDPFAHSREDVYVSPAQIRRCELRGGDEVSGPVRPPRRSERYPSLIRVDTVNGSSPEPPSERPRFEDLTAVFATERLSSPDEIASIPYGKGSRVALSGPPGSGITTLLRNIASTLVEKNGDLDITVVLVGVRPEEVTEWRRDSGLRVAGGGFDAAGEHQSQAAEMAVELAKRAVETGRDAVLVVDALDALPPGVARRVFGSARNAEEGGSLTVFAAIGAAHEALRVATTRIMLEPAPGGGAQLAPSSGATRAELLG
ncbi:MAG: Rho termination factor N-terminal domain-containing protein [Thermoleophilaceae bacterium]